jgi:hypothetical protein
MKRIIGNDVARFWSKVLKTQDCWLWLAATNPEGYGRFFVDGKFVGPHRYSYELHGNPIPEKGYIDHLCKNPSCVRPDHLEVVTNRENAIWGDRVVNKKSGLPVGVTHDRGRFKAAKMIDGRGRTLGRFDTPAEAHAAYMRAV